MVPSIWISPGRYFNFVDLDSNQWDINNVAHNLSLLCRFNGSIPKFYSVAEHSVYVSRQLPEHLKMAGLLHDMHEAFVGDVTSPLKSLLPDYRAVEDRVQRHCLSRYGLGLPLHPDVKLADLAVYIAESIQLRGIRDDKWTHVLPARVRIRCYVPEVACEFFLEEFCKLLNRDDGKVTVPL